MDNDVSEALHRSQLIDLTTTGRRSGLPRRIEIFLHDEDGVLFITGLPRRDRTRDWIHNITADPRVIVHLKVGIEADVRATARIVTDPHEARPLIEAAARRSPSDTRPFSTWASSVLTCTSHLSRNEREPLAQGVLLAIRSNENPKKRRACVTSCISAARVETLHKARDTRQAEMPGNACPDACSRFRSAIQPDRSRLRRYPVLPGVRSSSARATCRNSSGVISPRARRSSAICRAGLVAD